MWTRLKSLAFWLLACATVYLAVWIAIHLTKGFITKLLERNV